MLDRGLTHVYIMLFSGYDVGLWQADFPALRQIYG